MRRGVSGVFIHANTSSLLWRQLRASVALSSKYERRLQQAYTAFVKLFLEAEMSEPVTTCFALHCCHSAPHKYPNLCSPSDSHLACCFAA